MFILNPGIKEGALLLDKYCHHKSIGKLFWSFFKLTYIVFIILMQFLGKKMFSAHLEESNYHIEVI